MHRQKRPAHEVEAWSRVKEDAAKATDEDLMMSRRNTHCYGIDSIVLSNIRGQLRRVWLAWPEAKLYNNTPESKHLELSIHNHRYDISLQGVFGTVVEQEWESVRNKRRIINGHGVEYSHYTFDSPLTGGEGPKLVGPARLSYIRGYKLAGGFNGNQSCYLEYDKLHTIFVPQNTCAAWRVDEGPRRRDWTDMYTNQPGFALLPNLYKPFPNALAVRDHLARFELEADVLLW